MSADTEQSVFDCAFGDCLGSWSISDDKDVDVGDTDTTVAPTPAIV